MKTAALIVNPFSTRVSEERLHEVEEALSQYAEVDTLPTRRRRHATRLAGEAAQDHDAVFVYSGDGVFNEALNGVDGQVPLGFIPGGRTNVLPRALGLPRDPVAAARQLGEALQQDRTRTISLGRANGRRFAFAAGVGFDAEFMRRLENRRHRKGLPGDLTAAGLFIRQFADHGGTYDPALEIEGVGRAASLLVANGDPVTYVGPFQLRLVPEASFERGLAFAAAPEMRAHDFFFATVRALRGREHPRYLYGHELDRIAVTCDTPMPLQVDGEDLGDVDSVVFEAEPDAARVLV